MSNSRKFAPARLSVLQQVSNQGVLGLGASASSRRTESLAARTKQADKVVGSVCLYCEVGCAQLVYVKNELIINIEGDPASPVSHGACGEAA